jgi:hypothetical protein
MVGIRDIIFNVGKIINSLKSDKTINKATYRMSKYAKFRIKVNTNMNYHSKRYVGDILEKSSYQTSSHKTSADKKI